MKHRASKKFCEYYHRLPDSIRELADSHFQLLKTDLRHPSLHFKNVGRYWSVRIGIHYRALAVQNGNDLLWFWIGPHGEYDRLL